MRKIESVPNVQDVYVSKRREFSTQYGLHNENPVPSFYLLLNPPRGAGSEAEPGLVHIIINTIYTFSACSVLGVPNDDAANDFIVALANHSDNAYNWVDKFYLPMPKTCFQSTWLQALPTFPELAEYFWRPSTISKTGAQK